MKNLTHPDLSGPPLAAGRILTSPSEMDWSQHTYWVDSKGPLVVISEHQKLIQGVACPPPPEVPEPSYAAAVLLTLCFLGRGLRRRPR